MLKKRKTGLLPGTRLNLGIDIGSISLNTVLIDDYDQIIENRYDYCHGKPFHRLKEVLALLLEKYSDLQIATLSLTGSGGKLASELIGGHYVNEIIAQSSSASRLYPTVKTIIEMGGQDSKYISIDHGNIPYVSIAYDGHDNTTIDMRIQAFMHQAREFARENG